MDMAPNALTETQISRYTHPTDGEANFIADRYAAQKIYITIYRKGRKVAADFALIKENIALRQRLADLEKEGGY